MMFLSIALLSAKLAFACGPDYCARDTLCGKYVGNRSPADEVYFISSCTGPLPILDANNFTHQNIELFLREAFGYQPTPEFLRSFESMYPDPALSVKQPAATDFFAGLVAAEKLSKDATQSLLDLRKALNQDVADKKTPADFAKRFDSLGDEAKKSQSLAYLRAAAAFYLGDFAAARAQFDALTGSSLPELAEAASYLRARTVLQDAQAKWDGYFQSTDQGPGGPDTAKATEAEKLFRDYFGKYPQGKFAASATGLLRKVSFLRRDAAGYDSLMTEAIAAVDLARPDGKDKLYTLLREYDGKGDWKSAHPQGLHPYLWLIRSYYSQRNAPGEEWKPEEKKGELDRLVKDQKAFAQFPDLFVFAKANLEFGAGKFAEALKIADQISPPKFLLPRALVALKANALVRLKKFNEAETLVAKYIDEHPQELMPQDPPDATGEGADATGGRHLLSGLYTYLFSWQGRLEDAYRPENLKRINPGFLDILTRRTLSTARLQKLFAGQQDKEWREKVGHYLLARQVFRRDFAGAQATLAADPGILKPADAQKLQPVLATLSQNPRDPRGLASLAQLLVEDQHTDKVGMFSNYEVQLCGAGPKEKLDWPIQFFQTSLEKFPAAEKSDAERDALVAAISCFRTKSVSWCYDTSNESGIAKSTRKKWFQTLKKKYGESEQAKEIQYYW